MHHSFVTASCRFTDASPRCFVDPFHASSLFRVIVFQMRKFFSPVKFSPQRIYISDRTHSTPQHLPKMCPRNLSPPALLDSQVVRVLVYSILQTEQGEVAWEHVWKTLRGAVRFITNIYLYSLGWSKQWVLHAF